MILVDSNIVSSYDFVRYSETLHHINFIVVYRFQGKGENFVYIKWKKIINNLSQIINFDLWSSKLEILCFP